MGRPRRSEKVHFRHATAGCVPAEIASVINATTGNVRLYNIHVAATGNTTTLSGLSSCLRSDNYTTAGTWHWPGHCGEVDS